MKLHFHCLFWILITTVEATTVQELKDLKESGFSEEQILELVIKEKNYEVSDLIELKKLGFSPNFIISLRNKDLANAVNLVQSNSKEEISPFRDQIIASEKKLSDLEKCLTSITRTLGILESKNYESAGLWEDLGSLYKRNGYDQSLEAPARDSDRFLGLLTSAISGLSDDLGISENDCFSLIDSWVAMKRSAMEVDAISGAARSSAYKRSDNRPSPSISAELNAERSKFRNYSKTFEAKKESLISAIKKAIPAEKQNLEELLIKNKNGPYEEKKEGITYKGTWKGSKNHGKRLSFYENGQKEGEDNWIDGIKVGNERRWFENGNKKYEATWDSLGRKIGKEQSWHANGKLEFQKNWDAGMKNGESTTYKPSGSIDTSSTWEQGNLIEKRQLSENGDLMTHFSFEKDRSIISKKRVLGTDKFSEFNLDVKSHKAIATLFDSKTSQATTVNFFVTEDKSLAESNSTSHFRIKAGQKTHYLLLDGEYKITEGDFSYEGKFEKGIPVGLHKVSSNENNAVLSFSKQSGTSESIGKLNTTFNGTVFDGTITTAPKPTFTGKISQSKSPETFFFENNEMVKIIFKDGAKPPIVIIRNDNPAKFSVEDFYENGKPKAKLNFCNGYLEGVSELYRQDGNKWIRSEYADGLRQGLTKIFHSNGNVSCEITYENGEIKDKVSAFYEDGESYNPKSGFLSTKYSLKYSKDSIWRSGIFSRGMPSGKQLEFNRDGKELQVFENIKSLGLNNHYYGIFEIRFEPEPNEVPSFRDYNKFQKSDFYRISPDYKIHFDKLNLISESLHFMDVLEAKFKLLELDVQGINNLLDEKFETYEPPISSFPKRAIISYTIKRGDTLFLIAHRFNTTIAAIKSANHHLNLDNGLKIGQQIMIP